MIKDKNECRKVITKLLKSLKEGDSFESKSEQVALRLRDFLFQQAYIPKKIGGFYPLGSEVNWLLGNEDLNLLFPKMVGPGEMIFSFCKVSELKERKRFGQIFREPPSKTEDEPEIVIVPALAFDRRGNRLGRGKGFYDKYLANGKYITIGICFSEQLLDEVPVDENDIGMDFIITDSELIRIYK